MYVYQTVLFFLRIRDTYMDMVYVDIHHKISSGLSSFGDKLLISVINH